MDYIIKDIPGLRSTNSLPETSINLEKLLAATTQVLWNAAQGTQQSEKCSLVKNAKLQDEMQVTRHKNARDVSVGVGPTPTCH